MKGFLIIIVQKKDHNDSRYNQYFLFFYLYKILTKY